MKKGIVSFLLTMSLLLSAGLLGVISALAVDSCVSVKQDAVTTGEVVAGSLLEIRLSDVFEDTGGHALTYTLSNASQFGPQTKIKDGILYVSESKPGIYQPEITAVCSDGKKVSYIVTITVTEAPHGLDEQYNYDETPASQVTVYVTLSNDGVPLQGRDGTVLCHKAVTVPYFDLKLYDLEEFYRYHTENGEGEYVDELVVQRPTGLHLYLYLIERYFIGLPEEECCKGKYKRGDLSSYRLEEDVLYMDDTTAYKADKMAALTITGPATSLYMTNFWGHDENLMYYRNHCYPYMSPGWGSTSDYIVLSDGDTWDVSMYSNWSFWSNGGVFTCFDQDDYRVRPGSEVTLNTRAYGTTFQNSDFFDFSELDVFLYDSKWEQMAQLKAADDGKSTFSFSAPAQEGTYCIVGMDPNRTIAEDESGGNAYAKYAPATAMLHVSASAEMERPFQSISVNGRVLDVGNISYEGTVTLGSQDNEQFKKVYEEIPRYHVTLPEGTEAVDVTYKEGVDIYHADATAYGYETDLEADAVSSPTIRALTLADSYRANADGTQTVTMPVPRYIRKEEGSSMAVTLESGSTNDFKPVALFTFEYDKKEDPQPDVTYGDINGDNTVDVSDALLLCQIYLGNVRPTDRQSAAADVNGNGAADVSGALLICQYYLGNLTEFPAGKSD